MTNTTKWIVAVPFAAVISLVIPGLLVGEFLWFADSWIETTYVACSGGMWLVATAFVDLSRPRSDPDLANRLMPVGLISSVPISVWDHVHGVGSLLPSLVSPLGVIVCLGAIILGVSSRRILGRAYSPRSTQPEYVGLVRAGPYRLIRHPMYLAALLWAAGWPLLVTSLIGSFATMFFILPAILIRIRSEERELARVHGEAFEMYRNETWRLIPGIY